MNQMWLSAAFPIATSVILVVVGVVLARRRVAVGAGALRAFSTWWFCAATILLLVGLRTVAYLAGVRQAAAFTAVTYLIALPLAVGLACLLHYLIYLYTGRSALPVLLIAYTAFLAFALYYFYLGGTRTPHAGTWSVQMLSKNEPPGWLGASFGAAVALPILGAIVAYASLYPRAPRGEPRFRIAAVSTAFFLWFAPLMLGFALEWNREAWFPLVYQAPGVPAAALILLAYRPSPALRRRWAALEP